MLVLGTRYLYVGDTCVSNDTAHRAAALWPSRQRSAALRLPDTLSRHGVLGQLVRGSAGPGYKLPAAIRAESAELRFGARRAECAFEGADPCLRRVWREIMIAAFAAGA